MLSEDGKDSIRQSCHIWRANHTHPEKMSTLLERLLLLKRCITMLTDKRESGLIFSKDCKPNCEEQVKFH